MKTTVLLFLYLCLATLPAQNLQATPTPKPAPPAQASSKAQPTPDTSASYITDGGAGPCSAEFTVTGPDGKPVFAALINVHIAYGFAGIRKLDMGVYTNQQGKGKFTGIPSRVKRPPLEFKASKDQLSGVAMVDPAAECQATHNIVLAKSQAK